MYGTPKPYRTYNWSFSVSVQCLKYSVGLIKTFEYFYYAIDRIPFNLLYAQPQVKIQYIQPKKRRY